MSCSHAMTSLCPLYIGMVKHIAEAIHNIIEFSAVNIGLGVGADHMAINEKTGDGYGPCRS